MSHAENLGSTHAFAFYHHCAFETTAPETDQSTITGTIQESKTLVPLSVGWTTDGPAWRRYWMPTRCSPSTYITVLGVFACMLCKEVLVLATTPVGAADKLTRGLWTLLQTYSRIDEKSAHFQSQ